MPTNSQQVAALTGGSLQPNVCSSQDQHRNAFKHFYDHGDSDATIVNYKIIMDQQSHAAVFHLEISLRSLGNSHLEVTEYVTYFEG